MDGRFDIYVHILSTLEFLQNAGQGGEPSLSRLLLQLASSLASDAF